MLAVFKASVAEGPAELVSPHRQAETRKNGTDLINSFLSANSGAVCVNLGDVGAMAYTPKHQSLLIPRAFVAVDDIFCLFEGTLDNIVALRQQYGLNKSVNEVTIVIEAYRTLRDRGPYPADQVVRDLSGKFAFLLFDFKSQTLFTAATLGLGKKHTIPVLVAKMSLFSLHIPYLLSREALNGQVKFEGMILPIKFGGPSS